MIFRRATIEDCNLLYGWANEPAVRQNSFNSSLIEYEDHVEWFRKKLNSPDSHLYICMDKDKPIGQIRIEVENGAGIINFSVDSDSRGMGYGKKMLNEIAGILKEGGIRIEKLIGKVKPENTASKRAFEGAGYKLIKGEDICEYEKSLK